MNLWMEKECPKNIKIQDLGLNCYGALKEKRYGIPGARGFDGKFVDGIHMRGILAVKHYTDSFIRMLRPNAKNSWSAGGEGRSDYHSSCPQSVYQRNQGQYSRNLGRNNTGQQEGYRAHNYRGFRDNGKKYDYYRHGYQQDGNVGNYGGNIYNVPVFNRFSKNY